MVVLSKGAQASKVGRYINTCIYICKEMHTYMKNVCIYLHTYIYIYMCTYCPRSSIAGLWHVADGSLVTIQTRDQTERSSYFCGLRSWRRLHPRIPKEPPQRSLTLK